MPGCSWNPSEAWVICIKIGQHSGPYESILCNSCQYFYTWESGFILYYCSGINTPIALTKCYTSIIGISLGSEGYQHQSRQLHTSLTLFHFYLYSVRAVPFCLIWIGILSVVLTSLEIRHWEDISWLLAKTASLLSYYLWVQMLWVLKWNPFPPLSLAVLFYFLNCHILGSLVCSIMDLKLERALEVSLSPNSGFSSFLPSFSE